MKKVRPSARPPTPREGYVCFRSYVCPLVLESRWSDEWSRSGPVMFGGRAPFQLAFSPRHLRPWSRKRRKRPFRFAVSALPPFQKDCKTLVAPSTDHCPFGKVDWFTLLLKRRAILHSAARKPNIHLKNAAVQPNFAGGRRNGRRAERREEGAQDSVGGDGPAECRQV